MLNNNDVRKNAIVIWKLLSLRGQLSAKEICEFTNLSEPLLFLALGWLIKEEKVHFADKEGTLFAGINSVAVEMYY